MPNWTGFNYLIEEGTSDSCHEIGYLPAIDKSPTTFEVVRGFTAIKAQS